MNRDDVRLVVVRTREAPQAGAAKDVGTLVTTQFMDQHRCARKTLPKVYRAEMSSRRRWEIRPGLKPRPYKEEGCPRERASIVPQGHHRLHPYRAPCRNPAGQR